MSYEDNYVGRALAGAEEIAGRIATAADESEALNERFTLIRGVAERNRAVRQGILTLMKRTELSMTPALTEFLIRGIAPRPDGAILALADLNRWSSESTRSQLVTVVGSFLSDPNIDTRIAAIVALRILNTDGSRTALLEALHQLDASELNFLLIELSLTRDASLIPSILEFVRGREGREIGTMEEIPFYLSYLVDAEWFGENFEDSAALLLAERFGYVDAPTVASLKRGGSDEVAAAKTLLLAVGVVSQPLLEAFCAAGHHQSSLLADWQERVRDIVGHLLPDTLTEKRPIPPPGLGVDLEAQVSRHLLFAALRAADAGNFAAKLELSPFHSKGRSQAVAAFFFKSFALFDGAYFPKALARARQFFLSDDDALADVLVPFIVLDFALIDSETRAEESLETKFLFECRWSVLVQLLETDREFLWVKEPFQIELELRTPGVLLSDHGALVTFIERLRSPEHQHLLRYGLLDVGIVRRTDEFMSLAQERDRWTSLSHGAQAALRVYVYDLLSTDQAGDIEARWEAEYEEIIREERLATGLLPSLGLEIQSNSVPGAKTFAWKEALLYFGIPSPRRPEFFDIVEPAFPPVYSPRAATLLIRILHSWGLHENYESGSAMHYSLGVALGDDAKYLAIGLRSFVTEKPVRELSQSEWYRSIARLMSKGLIHRNGDSVAARSGELVPDCHTEIRVLRLQDYAGGSAELDPSYEVFVPGGQLLAAAAVCTLRGSDGGDASKEQFAQIWSAYRNEIEALYLDPRYGQAAFLETDWYAATGDPDDISLVGQLPVIEAMVAGRRFLRERPGLAEKLRQQTNDVFVGAVQRLAAVRRESKR
ncbi:MAG: hypothetical protein ACI8XO_001307 [Verrucomicrobiales bacterium]|jgi:hypothetical protein